MSEPSELEEQLLEAVSHTIKLPTAPMRFMPSPITNMEGLLARLAESLEVPAELLAKSPPPTEQPGETP